MAKSTWSDGDTRHAAVLHGDVAGYSKLTADNEIETHQTLQTYRRIIEEETGARDGSVQQFVGDEFLAVFPDERSALEAALDIQRHIADGNARLPAGRQMRFRLGINSGPISLQDGHWYGDTINVAARLQAMGEPGGITISGPALDAVGDIDVKIESQGRKRLKWELANRSPTGVTGVTGVGMTVSDPLIDSVALAAVRAVDARPHGIFSVDMTNDAEGVPNPTEINIGRFFTTSLFFAEAGLNMPHIFTRLALGEEPPPIERKINPLPPGLLWVRGMDREPRLVCPGRLESAAAELAARRTRSSEESAAAAE